MVSTHMFSAQVGLPNMAGLGLWWTFITVSGLDLVWRQLALRTIRLMFVPRVSQMQSWACLLPLYMPYFPVCSVGRSLKKTSRRRERNRPKNRRSVRKRRRRRSAWRRGAEQGTRSGVRGVKTGRGGETRMTGEKGTYSLSHEAHQLFTRFALSTSHPLVLLELVCWCTHFRCLCLF